MADSQTNSASLWDFLTELVQRFGNKTPAFFNILRWVGAGAAALTALPAGLMEAGIVIPPIWTGNFNLIVRVAGIVVFVVAKLPSKNADVIAKSDADNKLPLTRAKDLNLPPSSAKN